MKRDNEKSRKSLEASMYEYTLVTRALEALGMDSEDVDVNDSAPVGQKEVHEKKKKHKTDEKSVQPDPRHVTFSSKEQKAIIHTEDEQRGEKEKRRFTTDKSRTNT